MYVMQIEVMEVLYIVITMTNEVRKKPKNLGACPQIIFFIKLTFSALSSNLIFGPIAAELLYIVKYDCKMFHKTVPDMLIRAFSRLRIPYVGDF